MELRHLELVASWWQVGGEFVAGWWQVGDELVASWRCAGGESEWSDWGVGGAEQRYDSLRRCMHFGVKTPGRRKHCRVKTPP